MEFQELLLRSRLEISHMNRILVTGLCTLHWGRLQYGNVGNYYIIEPMFRLLHKYFPEYEIITTFQMDETFIKNENVKVLPMDIYYSWSDADVANAEADVECAKCINANEACTKTPFIEALLGCEYVINISGDMWGDNAEHVGHERFYVDCLKMKAAQLLGVKTILYAVTPGPFKNCTDYNLAKDVFESFELVLIREKVSKGNLQKWGFDTGKVKYAPCPSFLFEPNQSYKSKWTELVDKKKKDGIAVTGMTFGGFNMPVGPYDMWPRADEQYVNFEKLAVSMIEKHGSDIVLFSHTNGFELPPNFKLINGRDFVILNQFYNILIAKYPEYKDRIHLVDEPLLPCDLKSLIGRFDMLVTGRVHASVAATSQCVPTMFIEYDRRVIYSDKMTGFSAQLDMEDYVCSPEDVQKMLRLADKCFENRYAIRKKLEERMKDIKNWAEAAYEQIKNV